MKICRTCGVEKPYEDFYKHSQMLDGRLNICRDCTKGRVKRHRRLNDHVREYDRNRGLRRPDIVKRWGVENPTRKAASTAVNNAIRDGRMQKEPCVFCGSEKVEGHHKDYSKPLHVIWLCPKCHKRLHALFPETITDGSSPF